MESPTRLKAEGSRLKGKTLPTVLPLSLEPRALSNRGTLKLGIRAGQTVLELILALIVTLLLCVGIIGIWGVLVHNIVGRQIAYDRTRCLAGTARELNCGGRPGEPGKSDYFTPGGVVVQDEEPPVDPPVDPPGDPPVDPPGCVPNAARYDVCTRACAVCALDIGAQCSVDFEGMSTPCTFGTDIDAYCREYAGCPP
jgi:hypothetical protein